MNPSPASFPWRRIWTAAVFLALAGIPLALVSVRALFQERLSSGTLTAIALGLGFSAVLLRVAVDLARGRKWAWDMAVFLLGFGFVGSIAWAGMMWSRASDLGNRAVAILPVLNLAIPLACLLSARDAWDRSSR